MCHIKTKLDDWFSWTLKNEVRVAQARLLGAEKGPDESGQNRATSRHQERPLLGAYHLALCVSAQAQQPKKVPRVGFLTLLTHPDPREEEFVQGLRELGHIDGQNITIEYRRSAGEVEHLATLAKELVRLKVDLIVARSTPAIEAAKNVTKTIPIVMLGAADPVRSGFVVSLARPGGNITDNSNINPNLQARDLNC